MKKIIEKILLILGAPFRILVRYEISRTIRNENKDIRIALQKRALETTCEYVGKYMYNVNSVNSDLALLTYNRKHEQVAVKIKSD